MNNLPDTIFWLILVGIGVYFVFNAIRRGGFKGAMFNASISQTIGEVKTSGATMVNTKVKVHLLERDTQKMVGLEVVNTSMASYEMVPVVLSKAEAKHLISVLEETVSKA